ncbi:DUF1835 domain-containing protein [Paenibacillus sp. FSL R5-0527]|uniref:DUF1835 domain-containing protein n=1 Tax=Paenibacillus sp. FSL R5-0527 TaxID=2975321 RepID=UPI0026BB5C72
MLAIRKATDSLEEEELRAYLRLILVQIERMKEEGAAPNTAITGLIELYDGLIALPDKKRIVWDPAPACTHVHIVIGDSFAGSMKQALKGLGWEEAHKLIVLRENYAIGPLADLDSPAGRTARSEWFGDNIMNGLEAYSTYEDEYMVLLGKLEQIPEQAELVVWTTRNACEQAGMRYALHLLRHKPNPLSVYDACAICEALYNRPDAITRYRHSGELPPSKLQAALVRMDGSGRLSGTDIAKLIEEWRAIAEQTGTLRIWRDGAVIGVPADYYDSYLLDKLDRLKPPAGDRGFLRSARLIGEALGYCEQYVGDEYFEYRLRTLIYNGVLEIKGVPAAMRFYSVRRKR